MSVYEDNIIPIKIAHLAEYVSKVKRISLDDALVYIYVNPMYERLYDEEAKWWYLSTEALYEEFEHRRSRQSVEVFKPVFEFYTFCLENYATRKRLSGMQAWVLFKETGADEPWLYFVTDCRKSRGHDYDLVLGPVANDKVFTTVNLFESGVLSAEAAILQLKAYKTYDQLSFHTARTIGTLRFVEAYEV